MCAPVRTETVAVLTEGWIKDRLQHLKQRLLNQTIRHRRDAKLALASIWLWDRYPTHRLRPVRALQQLFPDCGPFTAQPVGSLVDIQSVDSGRALVGPHPFPCLLHVLSCQCCSEQPRPCALRFMTRAPGFVAAWIGQGCTLPCSRPLRRSGHLTLCPSHRHAVEHSSSFGPSFTLASKLLRPRLTSRSGSTPSPLQA